MKEESLRTLIDDLLLEQQQISAIEKFSRYHKQNNLSDTKVYRDLIPVGKPGRDQQYAFEVDLDVCSGCKACVVACHSLNGLDETETWRDVGNLIGTHTSTQQTVTTACHHCADPACLDGCPTRAYEKEKDTGIVKHLDDQCIGCRYCEMKCPYEVPKYNERLGIVRKCDMCHGRISEGEAPACAQACPNEAIKIRIVSKQEIDTRARDDINLVPGTFTSSYTKPSTRYLNVKRESEPSDKENLEPAHAHWPLVWMLVLTQAGTGILAADFLTRLQNPGTSIAAPIAGCVLFFSGLTASVLHLGQPLKAWKAFLGWRTSWLSREIIVFGGVGGLAPCYVLAVALNFPDWVTGATGGLLAMAGLTGIWTSVKVYSDTKRPFWSTGLNLLRFFGTALSFGLILTSPALAAPVIVSLLGLEWYYAISSSSKYRKVGKRLFGPLKRSLLLRQILGGMAILFLFSPWIAAALFLGSEIAGRSIFFRAVDEPKMPGV